jgi:hypothetical protein
MIRCLFISNDSTEDREETRMLRDLFSETDADAQIEWLLREQEITDDLDADVIFVDYGRLGLSESSPDSLSRMTIRRLCHWAENHPSVPVVMWTVFTSHIYEQEFEEQFGHLENIFYLYQDRISHVELFYDVLMPWLGLKEVNRQEG